MEETLYDRMNRLLELILEERKAARSLDMARLAAVSREKEDLARALGDFDEADEDIFELAEQIRLENRRNAYLFWAGLNLVRDTMEFFGRQAPPPRYDALGTTVQSAHGGRLLSGRI